jgi:hypothetical protein
VQRELAAATSIRAHGPPAEVTRGRVDERAANAQWTNSAIRMITGMGTPRKNRSSERMAVS